MANNIETRTNATIQNASPRNGVAAPKSNKPRPSFLAGLLKALSAFTV
jgi:hypothetical protein